MRVRCKAAHETEGKNPCIRKKKLSKDQESARKGWLSGAEAGREAGRSLSNVANGKRILRCMVSHFPLMSITVCNSASGEEAPVAIKRLKQSFSEDGSIGCQSR